MSRRSNGRDPSFPFYGDDFFGSEKVMLMSDSAIVAYMRLLWHSWRDGSIPTDPASIAKICHVTTEKAAELWSEIADCWTIGPRSGGDRDQRATNPFLESIRAERDAYRKRCSELGKIGNDVRWRSKSGIAPRPPRDRGPAIPKGSLPSPSPSPSPSPVQVHVPDHAETVPEPDPEGFAAFWEALGKRVDRPAAIKAWKRLRPSPSLAATIASKAAEYAASKPEKKYRKNPASWINGRCWEDEIIHSNGSSNGHHSNKGPAYDLRNPDPNRFKGQPTIQEW